MAHAASHIPSTVDLKVQHEGKAQNIGANSQLHSLTLSLDPESKPYFGLSGSYNKPPTIATPKGAAPNERAYRLTLSLGPPKPATNVLSPKSDHQLS
ncbi:hypothetical protein H920_05611 [Fukomys damarensis]|uniref:Uncharacterized protein n=1 Tax=Fukomys damarensis TaxID=885580 RepID=A0A091DRU4_FUKDA|nr:hypothetical protein H920_05611 [Fukomys damarensis]